MERIERRTGCTAGHPRQMIELDRTNCSRHDTATTPSSIKYLDNGGQDGGQLGGNALDERGRDAVEAEGGHLSVWGVKGAAKG